MIRKEKWIKNSAKPSQFDDLFSNKQYFRKIRQNPNIHIQNRAKPSQYEELFSKSSFANIF